MAKKKQEAVVEDTGLYGMSQIRDFMGMVSETTVLRWIREEGFPASKLGGHSWVSDKIEANSWRRARVQREREAA